jgi:cytochrome c-type biogenesis protein CcmH/NrfF
VVCQSLSVADSPATMALNMKAQVREMLATGYNQDQILAYFERSYGECDRLDAAANDRVGPFVNDHVRRLHDRLQA